MNLLVFTFLYMICHSWCLAQVSRVGVSANWLTDTSKAEVALREIQAILPKEAFPKYNYPDSWNKRQAEGRYHENEPMVVVIIGTTEKAYPLQLLVRTGAINDWVAGLPLAITYCHLSGSVKVFNRRFKTKTGQHQVEFFTSGLLRGNNILLYDKATESWWQQATGRALAGELTGLTLETIPHRLLSFSQYFDLLPYGLVMKYEITQPNHYYHNPYYQYGDTANTKPMLFPYQIPKHIKAMAKLFVLQHQQGVVALPLEGTEELIVRNDTTFGNYSVFFQTRNAFCLHKASDSRKSPLEYSTIAYNSFVEGRRLTFRIKNQLISDMETNSIWNLLGKCTAGKLEGKQLKALAGTKSFAYSASFFYPELVFLR